MVDCESEETFGKVRFVYALKQKKSTAKGAFFRLRVQTQGFTSLPLIPTQ